MHPTTLSPSGRKTLEPLRYRDAILTEAQAEKYRDLAKQSLVRLEKIGQRMYRASLTDKAIDLLNGEKAHG